MLRVALLAAWLGMASAFATKTKPVLPMAVRLEAKAAFLEWFLEKNDLDEGGECVLGYYDYSELGEVFELGFECEKTYDGNTWTQFYEVDIKIDGGKPRIVAIEKNIPCETVPDDVMQKAKEAGGMEGCHCQYEYIMKVYEFDDCTSSDIEVNAETHEVVIEESDDTHWEKDYTDKAKEVADDHPEDYAGVNVTA